MLRKGIVILVIGLFIGSNIVLGMDENLNEINNIKNHNINLREKLDLTQGLVGHWNFDEGIGSITEDLSGKNNHGQITGAEWTNGISINNQECGSGLYFDGGYHTDEVRIKDSISFDSLEQTGEFSLVAWINPRQLTGEHMGFMGNDNIKFQYTKWEDIVLRLWQYDDTEVLAAYEIGALEPTWQMVSVTYERTTGNVKFYHNKYFLDTLTFYNADLDGNFDFIIGQSGEWGDSFNGTMDEVRVYNRTLNQDEIEYLFDYPCFGKGPNCEIEKPRKGSLYYDNNEIIHPRFITMIIGPRNGIRVQVEVKEEDFHGEVNIYIDNELYGKAILNPVTGYYEYEWIETRFGNFGKTSFCTLKAEACYMDGPCNTCDEIKLCYINLKQN